MKHETPLRYGEGGDSPGGVYGLCQLLPCLLAAASIEILRAGKPGNPSKWG